MSDLLLTLPPETLEAIAQRAADLVIDRLRGEQADGSPWLSIAEAAEYLRTSTRTVQRLVQSGRLPSLAWDGSPALCTAPTWTELAAGEEIARTTPPRREE